MLSLTSQIDKWLPLSINTGSGYGNLLSHNALGIFLPRNGQELSMNLIKIKDESFSNLVILLIIMKIFVSIISGVGLGANAFGNQSGMGFLFSENFPFLVKIFRNIFSTLNFF